MGKEEEISWLNINGLLIQNQLTIANTLNSYFSATAEEIMGINHIDKMNHLRHGEPVNNILQNCKRPYPGIKFRYKSTKEIKRIIKSLKTKNAHRYDEISVKILKWCAPFISSPLTYICNKSLELGIFPSRLKYSTVKSTFKLETDLTLLTTDQSHY